MDATRAAMRKHPSDRLVLEGEASGGAPNFWADPDTVTLPNSGLNVLIATRYVGIGGPDDQRTSVKPDEEVPLTAADYFAGRDPVLERALSLGPHG